MTFEMLNALLATAMLLPQVPDKTVDELPPAKPVEEVKTGEPGGTEAPSRRIMPLTLEHAIRLAESNSLPLRIDEVDVQIAKGELGRAIGEFDTVFFLSALYEKSKIPSARVVSSPATIGPDGSVTQGSSDLRILPLVTEDYRINTGFRGQLVNGSSYTVDLNYVKSEDESSDGGSDLNPSYRTDVGVAFTQPLLRGYGTAVNKATILSARNTLRGSHHALAESRVQRAREAITGYWNYYFARRFYETRVLLVEQSERLVQINRKKEEVGEMKALDVIEAEAELAQRQQELIVAQNDIERTADELRRLIFDFEDRELWEVELLPLTEASADFEDPPLLRDAAQVALERRPELHRRREFLKNNDLSIVVAENDLLPRLDFDATLRFNQLAGSKGKALNFDDDVYSLSAGITLEVPIGNRIARYNLSIARLQKIQALLDYKDAENNVIQEVRNGVREVLNSRKEIEAAREAVRLAAQRFSSELKRKQVGFSTTFDVREAQATWREAIDSETRALFNYEVAKAALAAAQGTLLEHYGILSSPEPALDDRAAIYYGS
jgi:outer membrane protein